MVTHRCSHRLPQPQPGHVACTHSLHRVLEIHRYAFEGEDDFLALLDIGEEVVAFPARFTASHLNVFSSERIAEAQGAIGAGDDFHPDGAAIPPLPRDSPSCHAQGGLLCMILCSQTASSGRLIDTSHLIAFAAFSPLPRHEYPELLSDLSTRVKSNGDFIEGKGRCRTDVAGRFPCETAALTLIWATLEEGNSGQMGLSVGLSPECGRDQA